MNRLLRHIAPFVLLASYLPMAVLSSVHVHHDTIDVHDDCLHCTGHLDKAHHHDHDCLFCDFLGQSYYVTDTLQPATILPVLESVYMPTPPKVSLFQHGVAQLRAPPSVG